MKRLFFFVVIGGLGLAILLSLGIWQLQRLAWKQDILATIDARIQDAPVDLPVDVTEDRDKYLPVAVEGEILPDMVRVLTSRKSIGPGYRLISPFLVDGRRVLLDRGFTPVESKPQVNFPGMVSLTGNLHWPDEVDSYTPAADLDRNIWYARDVAAMAAHLKTDPILIVLRDRTFSDRAVTPMPVTTSAISNDHLQYAITWFSLAFIWAAMTGYFFWRLRAKPEG